MLIFKSKIDPWFYMLIVLLILLCFFICLNAVQAERVASYVGAIATIILGVGFQVWLMNSTQYIVNKDILFVQCGPAKWNIPLNIITSVTETRILLSSPALSLDRLAIHYGDNNRVIVSPEEKSAFRKAIGFPK